MFQFDNGVRKQEPVTACATSSGAWQVSARTIAAGLCRHADNAAAKGMQRNAREIAWSGRTRSSWPGYSSVLTFPDELRYTIAHERLNKIIIGPSMFQIKFPTSTVYTFWAILTERLNKILKTFNSNNWTGGCLEVSMMRKFIEVQASTGL
ncbi:hypothetical protein GGX14DRAFT_393269 [Mycena pura]|uniref:Uncharacterized protein n=1 Tax=Mycena pura TaxID=153505 RepID=A0AAD6YDA8_9AGAR|nr:hypothetical protein GGX14DRAFT_393269 [Mycena pura]